MDLNQLLYHHQVALIGAQNSASHEAREWAGHCAVFFAEAISRHGEAEGHAPSNMVMTTLN